MSNSTMSRAGIPDATTLGEPDADTAPLILVVDDDRAVRKAFELSLSTAGYRVDYAASGADALVLLEGRGERVACVLLDIRMPDMAGTEVLARIRAAHPWVQVIMVTANDDVDTAVRCMRDGAFDYVLKPVQRAILLESIRRALRNREMLLENRRLAEENAVHRHHLEITVAERTAQLHKAYELLKRSNMETVRVLAETIEAKDSYTRGHCNRVRKLSVRLAEALGADRSAIEVLEYGALLHDIGKIGVPEAILNKNGPLTTDERTLFEKHPVVGETILKPLEFFRSCLPIVRHHHERFDGTGYPDRLAGQAIPEAARMVAIADAYDAMTSTRSYRPAMPREAAMRQIEAGAGTQFDPAMAHCFLEEAVFSVLA